jgi:hypothetical protein
VSFGAIVNREQKITVIARAVYEAVCLYWELTGHASSPRWEEVSQIQAACRHSVKFALRNPTPGAYHEDWRAAWHSEGWVYGPAYDSARRTSPALVPYEEVPDVDKVKDRIIVNITQALAKTFELSPWETE